MIRTKRTTDSDQACSANSARSLPTLYLPSLGAWCSVLAAPCSVSEPGRKQALRTSCIPSWTARAGRHGPWIHWTAGLAPQGNARRPWAGSAPGGPGSCRPSRSCWQWGGCNVAAAHPSHSRDATRTLWTVTRGRRGVHWVRLDRTQCTRDACVLGLCLRPPPCTPTGGRMRVRTRMRAHTHSSVRGPQLQCLGCAGSKTEWEDWPVG